MVVKFLTAPPKYWLERFLHENQHGTKKFLHLVIHGILRSTEEKLSFLRDS